MHMQMKSFEYHADADRYGERSLPFVVEHVIKVGRFRRERRIQFAKYHIFRCSSTGTILSRLFEFLGP